MPRIVVHSARARGALSVDLKANEHTGLPERFCAWDEDRTTLAVDAARGVPHAGVAFVGTGIDGDTLRVALDLKTVHVVADPMQMARRHDAPALAIACSDDHTAIASYVGEGDGEDTALPTDVSPAPCVVSPLRALQETHRVPPTEKIPDVPMGAYVPEGTWLEDLSARLRLVAQDCQTCGRVLYPPRAACPACRGTSWAQRTLSGRAEVYAVTRIGRGGAPSEFALEQHQVGAYWVGVVAWPAEGVRVTARLVVHDDEAPAIGEPVEPVVRRLFTQEGRIRYGLKFRRAP